ncbi:MAG: hypothetical protein Ct9H300mP16_15500 [Pseudomonadota bacterium]|nr:MAG: hypothetical protein Ct9H300mP16_15500 [Pseudomonadota bacterium]
MLDPVGIGLKTRFVNQFLDACQAAEGAPQRIVRDAEDDRPVRGLEGLVGTQ